MFKLEIKNLIGAKTRQKLRNWLEENSNTKRFCWVIVSMSKQSEVIQYLDAVEEALCFGWIDGIKKKISDTELAQRLSPRNKTSNWTELMRPESFTIDKDIETCLKKDEQLYLNYINFPELYRRIRIDTIPNLPL